MPDQYKVSLTSSPALATGEAVEQPSLHQLHAHSHVGGDIKLSVGLGNACTPITSIFQCCLTLSQYMTIHKQARFYTAPQKITNREKFQCARNALLWHNCFINLHAL